MALAGRDLAARPLALVAARASLSFSSRTPCFSLLLSIMAERSLCSLVLTAHPMALGVATMATPLTPAPARHGRLVPLPHSCALVALRMRAQLLCVGEIDQLYRRV